MINVQNIPLEIKKVAEVLEEAGFEAYIVGGCVRDLVVGKVPKDWDLTTNAHPDQIVALFPESFCNNDYGTVGVKNEETEDAAVKVIEVTPYRSEGTYTDSRRPDSVTFGVSLAEDLARRDFTINAIAYRIKTNETVDLYEGIEDIRKKRIKTVGNPEERFGEDALRLMRAVRLAAELNFMIESETMAGIIAKSALLEKIAIERISSEFVKLINSTAPMQGIALLEKLQLLPYVLPEIIPAIGCEQGGIHAYDVYEHCLRTQIGRASCRERVLMPV